MTKEPLRTVHIFLALQWRSDIENSSFNGWSRTSTLLNESPDLSIIEHVWTVCNPNIGKQLLEYTVRKI